MSVLAQTRQDALALFESMGLPSKRNEDWKYTDASRLKDLLQPTPTDANIHIKDMGITGLDAYRMVFINGMFAEAESNLPEGVSILSLAELEKNSVGED
jgi:Fe-S cluster assembly protein SufD